MGRAVRVLALALFALIGAGTAVVSGDPLGECWVEARDQVEVRACLEHARERSDRAMEAALALARETAADLDQVTGRSVAVPALDASQQDWRTFQDANCGLRAALAAGGSGAGIFELNCRITMARQRADELARLASDRGYPLP
jgi:uncharacterized protein YecT (DUF1311 family)